MQPDDNVTQYLLFFSLFQLQLALAAWALPWRLAADQEAGQKWKSWAGHHTSACYASPLGRAWGNLMFGGKAASSGRCPLMTSLTFPQALSKSWNWPKVFAVIAKNIIIQPTLLDDWAFLILLSNWNVCCVKFWMQEGERRIICYLHDLFVCLRPMCLFSWLGVWFNTGYIWVIERLMRSGRRRRNIYFDFFFDRRVLKLRLHKHCVKVFFSFVLSTASLLFPDMVKILYWDIQVLKNSQWRWIIQIFGRFWPQLFWDNTFCWIDFG